MNKTKIKCINLKNIWQICQFVRRKDWQVTRGLRYVSRMSQKVQLVNPNYYRFLECKELQLLEKLLVMSKNIAADIFCQLCHIRQKVASLEYLRKTDRRHYRRFSCDLCDEGFQKRYILLHHMIASHENSVKNCRKCELRSYFYLPPNFANPKNWNKVLLSHSSFPQCFFTNIPSRTTAIP